MTLKNVCWKVKSSLLPLYFLSVTTASVVMPYIDLGVANIQHVPPRDDGLSEPIYVDFPFGHQIQSTIYVRFLIINDVM